jgi:ankyrin repeat protein
MTHDDGLRKYRQVPCLPTTAGMETVTPLLIAVFQGHEKIVEALLDAKADATISTKVQQTV